MRTQHSTSGQSAGMRQAIFALLLASPRSAGCSRAVRRPASAVNNGRDQAEQLAPVQGGSVSTTALPPIGPNGEVQGPTPSPLAPADGFGGDMSADRGNAGANDSLPTLPAVGALPNSVGPRPHRRADRRKAARPLDRRFGRRPVPAQPDPDRQDRHQPLPRLGAGLRPQGPERRRQLDRSPARRCSCSTRTAT